MFGRTYHRNTARQNSPRPRPARKAPEMNAADTVLHAQLVEAIEGGKLNAKDAGFAESLRFDLQRWGSLFPNKRDWAVRMVARANGEEAAPERPTSTIGDMAGIMALFDRAKVKHPKVRLQLQDGTPVVLGKAGPRSSAPGTVNVTDGGPFGANRWFGRLTKDGTWEQAGAASGCAIEMRALLQSFAAEPAAVASAYGKLTGNCAFCAMPLKDARSTEVGYGPVCAKTWGMPWGNK